MQKDWKAGMTVTVLYTVLAAAAFLAAVIVFVLCSPLWVRVVCADKTEIFAGISFIKIKLYPAAQKKKAKKRAKKKEKKPEISKGHIAESSQNTKKNISEKEETPKKSISDTLSLILDVVKSFFEMMGKRSKITIDKLWVVVSKEDAADTAVYFGVCNGIVASIIAFTSNFGKAEVNHDNIYVSPDFLTGKSSVSADVRLSVPAGSLLWSIIRGYLRNLFKK